MPEAPSTVRSPTRPWRGAARAWVLLSLLLACASHVPVSALGAESWLTLRLVPDQVKQGGVSVLSIECPDPIRALRLQAGGREIPIGSPLGQTRALVLIGVDLEQAPGPLLVQADAEDEHGRPWVGHQALQVLDAHFPVQRLSVPRPFVDLDPATLERVAREKTTLDRLWETMTPRRLWHGPFLLPLDGASQPSGFGVRRIINGEPRSPHTGADFAASPGAPVFAANAGVVALVADHFFAGTSVVLDHGLGLYTMYFHLQGSLVQPGQMVIRGQAIGHVGSSGRATGPHLHWGARLDGARIDPQALLHLPSLD